MHGASSSTSDILQRWKEIQFSLKQGLILEDDFPWKVPTSEEEDGKEQVLKYIGGVDVSCLKEDQSVACGTLVVLNFSTGEVVYHDSAHVKLHVPYIAGFLAFREAPVLVQLLEKMKTENNPYYPQLVMVDGNGILHPRGFGLASHVGVLENIPTIGIGKKLHCVDGLTEKGVRKCLQDEEKNGENLITLTGRSGRIHGAAMRSTEGSVRPIFISIGHRVSLDTAIRIVKMSCKYRVPEPIRQADKRSRINVQRPQEILEQLHCLNLEASASRETITDNHPSDDLRMNKSQLQNGSADTGRDTFREKDAGQQRRGHERGRWQEIGQVENEGQSNGRSRGGRGGTGQGRVIGRFGRGNNHEYAWVRKDRT